jgi:hypothetical protein
MYASGLWNGYWEQAQYGRQPMHDFVLRFADGIIRGEGHDVIGPFRIEGAYDDRGTVKFVKQYIGKHKVLYEGLHDGEGTILGHWQIPPFWEGTFALRPVHSQADPSMPIRTIE